jgi:23S rRNA pseudouridine2605 synthase
VNGSYVRDLATRISAEDDVRVHGKTVHAIASRSILLNKPAGYTTTRSDRHAERTIFDLLPSDCGHLFHVGRLDRESEGLLLLTNDGILAQELMHPSKGIDKEYEVVVDKPFGEKDAAALRHGTWIEGSVARVESVRHLGSTKIAIVLHQGIKRQIRVMLGQLGYKVQRLVRVRLGPLNLRGVKPGSYRELRAEDLEALRKAALAPKKKATGPAKRNTTKFTNFTVTPASAKTSIDKKSDLPPKRPRKTSPIRARSTESR